MHSTEVATVAHAPRDRRDRSGVRRLAPDAADDPRTLTSTTAAAIKALPWFTTVRKTLEDPAYAPWFLRFNCTNETRPFANCTLVQNVDYDRGSSGPLPDVPATSAADCCAQCAAYPGCWAATFPAGQQRCYFKTEVSLRRRLNECSSRPPAFLWLVR